jgi:hypothetical protein
MSFATGVCVLALYCGTRDKRHRLIAFIYLGISSLLLIGLHLWFNSPADATREGIVLGELGLVINASLGIWSFIFLSVLGPTWLGFGYLFLKKTWTTGQASHLKKFWVFLGVVAIPMGMSFFILDRTRLGVVVGALPLFLFLIPEMRKFFSSIPATKDLQYPVMSAGILFWIMYPALIVDSGGLFRLPYAEFVALITGG